MTLLMCKFVDSEMEQDLMQENTVLFKPTTKEEKNSKPISDNEIDSSSDTVSDNETVPPVEEEVGTTETTSQDTDFEGDGCDENTDSKKDLDKKRKSPEKPATGMEEDKISPTKKAKTSVGEQVSPISFEQDYVDQAEELAVKVNDNKSEAIGQELKDVTGTKNDNIDSSNQIIKNKDDSLLIPGSKTETMATADDVVSHSIESVNENNEESEKVGPIGSELKNEDTGTEEIGREHNSIATNLKEAGEKNNIDTDVKQVTVKDLVDNGKPEDTTERSSNIQNSLNANYKKDASPKDSTQNDNVDQDTKMNGVVDKELKTDSPQTELNAGTKEVENMDDSELLTDPAILEAIKLSEITASKELDRVVEDAEEMEEESEEEEEEETEEPWKPEDYKIYSNSKEFNTLRQPRKSFMKTFRKELASIRFNSTTEPAPHGGNDQNKGSEKDETVPSQVNFLLNVGLSPHAETAPAKNKEEERLRRLDKISKLSNKAKLRMGRRSLKRLEDRFRSNLIRTVQQNTEVSTLCKEMLILDLNPTKYLWGSALLRKRELSKKLKEWFKQAKQTEAEELKNPSEDNPSLPSKLLRFTSCDTSAAPRLLLAIKIGKAGLDLKWQSTADQADFSLLATRHYELQCCHASTPWEVPSEWKTIGNIKAMPLPMACTIRKFEAGHIYSFKIRAVKSKKDRSEWSEPVSISL